MATINGARALGLNHLIGSLEPGKRADLIVIDCNKPHIVPNFNPVSTMVYAAQGQDVDTVFIDGRPVMRHRQVLNMDENKILAEATRAARDLRARVGLDLGPRWPVY
ncbi:amidohydrolase family protein [Moorella naiadis]|uniref:amidohydrolase family protein n=1 Tax=Moorella naiadis (nom. illeg.) TaxID=3093670 RepID=UPI003D9CB6F5